MPATETALDICNYYVTARNRMKPGSSYWVYWNMLSEMWWEIAKTLEK